MELRDWARRGTNYNGRVRPPVDERRLREFLTRLGELSRGPGRLYLTDGATALTFQWRDATVDIDLRLDPEPDAYGRYNALLRDLVSCERALELRAARQVVGAEVEE